MGIVPVLIKTKESQSVVETYAFLDSDSNSSSWKPSREAQGQGKANKADLNNLAARRKLGRMFPWQFADKWSSPGEHCRAARSLFTIQSTYPSGSYCNPTRHEPLATPKGVKIPKIKAEIGLLIRSDVPLALQPGEFIPSENGGPFATRTILGWVLNSAFRPGGKDPWPTVSELLQPRIQRCSLRIQNSLHDRRALDIMEESLRKKCNNRASFFSVKQNH